MDYSGFTDFPFPAGAAELEQQYFLSLSDEEQLRMLNGCESYEEFLDRVQTRRKNSAFLSY